MSRDLRMERSIVLRLLLALMIAIAGGIVAQAANPPSPALPADGWASWQVDAVAGAPNWCCFDWQGKRAGSATCRLDGHNQGYGSRDRDDAVEAMRIYARFERGVLTRIRALGPSCPAEAKTAIADLGELATDASAGWLASQANTNEDLAGDVLAALAVHAGPVARDALLDIARHGPDRENRKNAVFWMGQVRAADSGRELEAIMFDDADPQLREHAAFALSQSDLPGRTAALVRLGKTDREPEVRGQAWFWLAQTGAPESEAAIAEALRSERDDEVREQAIFALSQLPDERAVDALGAIVKDPSRSREERKRALFWLGQSDSPRAQTYLADILDAR